MEDEDWPLSFLRVLAILVQADEISFMYQVPIYFFVLE